MSELAHIHPSGEIYRLGRRDPGVWRFPDWLHADKDTGTFGSRYDDPESEYRVLYACSNRACAFVEVLAYHAADDQLLPGLDEIAENDDSDADHPSLRPGHLDIDAFCAERSVGSARVPGDRAFASVADSTNLDAFNSIPAVERIARSCGLIVPFSAEDLRMTCERPLTQAVGRATWEQSTPEGEAAFAGVHYLSRHDATADNWGLFEMVSFDNDPAWRVVENEDDLPLEFDDPDLLAALELHGIVSL